MWLEDYALIGDTHTAALVGNNGSIDWLCLPRFDSAACFASLLGGHQHGRWLIAPAAHVTGRERRYRAGTLVLETDYFTEDGAARLIDCMPIRGRLPEVIRVVEGLRGSMRMRMELIMRFDYGAVVPWVRNIEGVLHAVAGPDALCLRTPVRTEGRVDGEQRRTVAEFTVDAGERVPFVLQWHPSHDPLPPRVDADRALEATTGWWQDWSNHCTHSGPWHDVVIRSLVTLKALTYEPTGGIVAAPTTSLPERLGGRRNWDYRYCWIRDSTFALYALLTSGYKKEAVAWRDWLLRAVAGDPSKLQIMYGVSGERRLTELELSWLPGYEGSSPVRVGNAAWRQSQLDVFGELMDTLHTARRVGVETSEHAWAVQRHFLDYLEHAWDQPDEGIWETRGPKQQFVHSKVMAWVAVDRAVRDSERYGLPGDRDRWSRLRALIHAEVCAKGYDASRRTFVQSYGSRHLDSSLLLMPLVGFLPPSDERIRGTVQAIERELMQEGFLLRYSPDTPDGLPPGEGVFLACSFWLADTYVLLGEMDKARRLFERLVGLRNDVGLLSEEYEPQARRMLGNFPQALSHLSLVNTAYNLSRKEGPAAARQN
ncbi:MAG TPA: glycoside hydrolase family 15 protein [Nitrospira sp.]|nr:glycoside hydrolase family 15 protein [Nitrospira sp.]